MLTATIYHASLADYSPIVFSFVSIVLLLSFIERISKKENYKKNDAFCEWCEKVLPALQAAEQQFHKLEQKLNILRKNLIEEVDGYFENYDQKRKEIHEKILENKHLKPIIKVLEVNTEKFQEKLTNEANTIIDNALKNLSPQDEINICFKQKLKEVELLIHDYYTSIAFNFDAIPYSDQKLEELRALSEQKEIIEEHCGECSDLGKLFVEWTSPRLFFQRENTEFSELLIDVLSIKNTSPPKKNELLKCSFFIGVTIIVIGLISIFIVKIHFLLPSTKFFFIVTACIFYSMLSCFLRRKFQPYQKGRKDLITETIDCHLTKLLNKDLIHYNLTFLTQSVATVSQFFMFNKKSIQALMQKVKEKQNNNKNI